MLRICPSKHQRNTITAVVMRLIVVCLLVNTAHAVDSGTPVLVHLLFRHGDRTPIDPYPTDPFRNRSYWPEGYGQLTNVGKEQEYELGQWFRKRYGNWLPNIYDPDDIYVRSTDVDRTLMSAETVLAALYPPEGRQRWRQNLGWQPIPVHTTPEREDELLAGKKTCLRYQDEWQKVMNSEHMKKYNEKYKELYSYLTNHSGREVKNVDDVLYLYDTLHVETLKNLSIPEWTKAVFPTKMAPPAKFAFKLPTLTKEMKRLKGGPFVKEVITHMLLKVNSSLVPDRKIFMYSAHDDTLSAILNTLHIYNDMMPPYSSAVVLELRVNAQQEYEVAIFYKNTTDENPFVLTIPGCTAACPLANFIDLTKNVVPEDWKEECLMSSTAEHFEFSLLSIITLGISTVLAILLVISVLLGTNCCRKQNADSYYYHRVQTES
ncbi:prostatic acid phosphatase-like [Schistocerca cancellata]|uniref:prostatic acid phosphatase-like n=1 Tax=Schistocerca cancellata TaxID=274614 RepID=UPI0021198446|nr:prostatic acid phosphatase-like [Schistocerca cancellata]